MAKGDYMALNTLKKTLLFTTEENKNLVDIMVEDESFTTKIKTSAILENHLLNDLLTTNSEVSFWIKSLYSGKSSGEILSLIFQYNAAGVNWESCHLELLPFIDFAINEQKYCSKNKVDEKLIPHYIDQLKSMSRNFNELLEQSLDFESKSKYTEALETIDFLVRYSKENPQDIQFINYYRLCKWYWDDVKNWSVTFRALTDVADMQTEWRNDSESRYLLVDMLRKLANEWPKKIK